MLSHPDMAWLGLHSPVLQLHSLQLMQQCISSCVAYILFGPSAESHGHMPKYETMATLRATTQASPAYSVTATFASPRRMSVARTHNTALILCIVLSLLSGPVLVL